MMITMLLCEGTGMGKIERNKQAKRATLLQSAFDLFVDKGFQETTISDISKRSGLAKGTFYLYFRDKYDLRDQLVARKSGQLLKEASEQIKTSREQPAGFEKYLFTLLDSILYQLQDNKMLLRFISKNLSWGVFKHAAEHHTDDDTFDSVYTDYLHAMEDGQISCSQPELMLFTILELVSSTGYNCIMYESPTDLQTYLPWLHKSIHQIILGFSV